MQPFTLEKKRTVRKGVCSYCQDGVPSTEIVEIRRKEDGNTLGVVEICKGCLAYKRRYLGKWFHYEVIASNPTDKTKRR